VLTPGTDVAERAAVGPDAPRDAADNGERAGKGDPARQGGPLALIQVIAQGPAQPGQQISHTRTLRPALLSQLRSAPWRAPD